MHYVLVFLRRHCTSRKYNKKWDSYQLMSLNSARKSKREIKIKASVVVPIYCGEDTVGKCINSILNQKFNNFEIIIIDDASKDNSINEIKKLLGNTSQRYKILYHKKNQGIAYTLNQGINESKGKFVLLIHQDCELINNEYISTAVKNLEKNKNTIAICGKPVYPIEEFNFFEKIFMIQSGHSNEKNPNNVEEISFSEHKCDIFRKELLQKNGGFNQIDLKLSGEDQLMSFQLKKQGYKFQRDNNLLYIQRYGKSVGSLKSLLKKIFRYGFYQAKVIILTSGKTLQKEHRSTDLNKRMKNRILGSSLALFFIFFMIMFVTTRNVLIIIPTLIFPITRVFHVFFMPVTKRIMMTRFSRFFAGIITFFADIIYFFGLVFGTIASIWSHLTKKF